MYPNDSSFAIRATKPSKRSDPVPSSRNPSRASKEEKKKKRKKRKDEVAHAARISDQCKSMI
jgi:hypothetical protein